MPSRRIVLGGLLGGATAAAGAYFWPESGFTNPCLGPDLPDRLRDHELVAAAWDGLDPNRVWDGHVHLVGVGDSDSGIWVAPQLRSIWHPIQYAQYRFYLDAACVDVASGIDRSYINRLVWLAAAFPPGAKFALLAFDYVHDEQGRRRPEQSAFYTPNEYAQRLAAQYPQRFEWIASIHPYRDDCVEALHNAIEAGARAVKWLPPAMAIDPFSPLCDRFYDVLAATDVPLLSHAGTELAVHGGNREDFSNPLRLRRALEHGVRVIVAHCASLGHGVDLDHGTDGPKRNNFELFARLMAEPAWEGRLFGEISSLTQVHRIGEPLRRLVRERGWQARLVNGSDFPLPGIMPLTSVRQMVRLGFIAESEAPVLSEIRRYHPLLFDFMVKRLLRVDGQGFADSVFETRGVFDIRA
jgi:predicted TIM-barrel fold metal-dependent hydrolase